MSPYNDMSDDTIYDEIKKLYNTIMPVELYIYKTKYDGYYISEIYNNTDIPYVMEIYIFNNMRYHQEKYKLMIDQKINEILK